MIENSSIRNFFSREPQVVGLRR